MAPRWLLLWVLVAVVKMCNKGVLLDTSRVCSLCRLQVQGRCAAGSRQASSVTDHMQTGPSAALVAPSARDTALIPAIAVSHAQGLPITEG